MSILEKVDFIRNLENANQHPPPKKDAIVHPTEWLY